MKKIIISIIFIISISNIFANESFEFARDCIKTFDILNKATIELKTKLDKAESAESVTMASMNYVDVLMSSHNSLKSYSESNSTDIKQVSGDLQKLMLDIVKENYSFLESINESNSISNTAKEFNSKIDFVTSFFNQITLGICLALVKENPDEVKKETDKQYLLLTQTEVSELNMLLINSFGKNIEKGQKGKSKTAFEASSRIIYEFLHLTWEYEKN